MSWLTNLVRDYFGFSATEIRGFWVLSFLAVLFLIIPICSKTIGYSLEEKNQSFTEKHNLDSLIALLDVPPESPKVVKKGEQKPTKLQLFNPNGASKEVLQQNGMPAWLADRIIKYREKGGKFRVKKDLLKIYGFSDELYNALYPFIELPDKQFAKLTHKKEYKKIRKHTSEDLLVRQESLVKMDINLVDSISLQRIQGIGTVLSARIIRFRDKLGGIYDPKQFSEIYHISPEVAQNLKDNTFISPNFETKKININTDDVSTLASHPYISFSLARAIVQHRDNYGNFHSLNDCREVYLMDEVIFQKLIPYLSL